MGVRKEFVKLTIAKIKTRNIQVQVKKRKSIIKIV